MKSRISLPLVLLALWIQSAATPPRAAATPPSTATVRPLAVVGGDTLTTEDLDAEISATLAEAKGREFPTLDPDAVLKRLIQNRLLEQEGYRTGADQVSTVRNQVRDYIRLKSVRALLDRVSAPGAGTVQQNADSLLGAAGMLKRYSHILVKDKALAVTLRDSLSRGAPFADLARRHSVDGSAAQGGDLGWAAPGAYVDSFEVAAARLSLNQISGPVRTQFGWHLITLTAAKADTLKSKAMAEALVQAREKKRRNALVESYIDSLKAAYGVTANDSLLATLDYQSKDPAVQKMLQSSTAVLAVLPTGKLTVRGLTRNIEFQYFHGLADRPDAVQIRDRMFKDWVIEGLLSFQARKLGLDRDPDILAKSRREERRLIREEVLGTILGGEFKPTDAEVRTYYESHKNDFIPDPRIKIQSVFVKKEETARRFRTEIDAGSQLKWLAGRSPLEVDSIPPFPADWMDTEDVGLKDKPLVVGAGVGPVAMRGGWAVAQIVAVAPSEPAPLATCREEVLRAMKGARYREEIRDAFARLESATSVQILEGAREATAERLLRLHASSSEGGNQ